MSNVIGLHRKYANGSAQAEPPLLPARDDGGRWAGLMVLAQDGDKAAYHRLLSEIVPYVRAIARRWLAGNGGASADIEDAVQEVLLVVHRVRHTYERGRPFRPWLGTIANRRIIDLLRRRSQRDRHESYADDLELREGAASPAGADPEDQAMRAADASDLRRAVAELPTRQREAVELLRLRELSLAEAAAASRQNVGSLKTAFHRAVKSLRDALSEDP